MMEMALAGTSRTLQPVIQSDSFDFMRHYVEFEDAISFQISIGLRLTDDSGLVSRPISTRDMPAGSLLLGQMKGRTLPIASARFAETLIVAMERLASGQA